MVVFSPKAAREAIFHMQEESDSSRVTQKSQGNDPEKTGLGRRFKGWLRGGLRGKPSQNPLKDALEEILEEHEQENGTQPRSEEETILKNVLSFSDKAVRDIMTPRPDIQAVEYTATLDELKIHIAQHSHTRIPVYNETLDNVKGFIHIKDLMPHLAGDAPFNMALILRDILFVPPSMKLSKLLLRMRVSGVHIAIVVDEYGGTDGLVTLEDVFEEIVGDIQDEHDDDEQEAELTWNMQGFCDVDARIPINKIEKALGVALRLPEDEEASYDTLGGLLFYQLGRVPAIGERATHPSGIAFEILLADPRRIYKVRINRNHVRLVDNNTMQG